MTNIKDVAINCGGYNRELTHAEDFDLYKKILSFGYAVHIDNKVITSARRFVGEDPLSLLASRFRRKLLHFFKKPEYQPFVNNYEDYRSK